MFSCKIPRYFLHILMASKLNILRLVRRRNYSKEARTVSRKAWKRCFVSHGRLKKSKIWRWNQISLVKIFQYKFSHLSINFLKFCNDLVLAIHTIQDGGINFGGVYWIHIIRMFYEIQHIKNLSRKLEETVAI